MKTVECTCCYRTMAERPVPTAWDDEGWTSEARRHAKACEWVATRAHMRPARPASGTHRDIVREDA